MNFLIKTKEKEKEREKHNMPNTFFNKKKPQKLRCRDEKNGISVKEVPLQGKIVCQDKKNIVDAEIVTAFFAASA